MKRKSRSSHSSSSSSGSSSSSSSTSSSSSFFDTTIINLKGPTTVASHFSSSLFNPRLYRLKTMASFQRMQRNMLVLSIAVFMALVLSLTSTPSLQELANLDASVTLTQLQQSKQPLTKRQLPSQQQHAHHQRQQHAQTFDSLARELDHHSSRTSGKATTTRINNVVNDNGIIQNTNDNNIEASQQQSPDTEQPPLGQIDNNNLQTLQQQRPLPIEAANPNPLSPPDAVSTSNAMDVPSVEAADPFAVVNITPQNRNKLGRTNAAAHDNNDNRDRSVDTVVVAQEPPVAITASDAKVGAQVDSGAGNAAADATVDSHSDAAVQQQQQDHSEGGGAAADADAGLEAEANVGADAAVQQQQPQQQLQQEHQDKVDDVNTDTDTDTEEQQQQPDDNAQVAAAVPVPPTQSPTAAKSDSPTQFSYFPQGRRIVHAMHTSFLNVIDINTNNDNDDNAQRLAQARLKVWKQVTLPSLQQQTNADFLYIVWIDRSATTQAWQEQLTTAVQRSGFSDRIVVVSTPATTLTQQHLERYDLRHSWYATFSSPVVWQASQSLVTGDGAQLWEYHLAALSKQHTRTVLSTTLEPGAALFAEYVASVQSEALLQLRTLPGVSAMPNYHVWCVGHVLEWRVDNPWYDKSTRGSLVGRLLENNQHSTQQCEEDSGLTIGYAAGTPPIVYTAQGGGLLAGGTSRSSMGAVAAAASKWKLPWTTVSSSNSNSNTFRDISKCRDDVRRDCLSYVDVGGFEYGVLVVKSIVDHDLRLVTTSHIDRQWKSFQDATFGVLEARFGVGTNILGQVRSYLKQQKLPLLLAQQAQHQQACGGPGNGNAKTAQTRGARRRLQSSLVECNRKSQAMVEKLLAKLRGYLNKMDKTEDQVLHEAATAAAWSLRNSEPDIVVDDNDSTNDAENDTKEDPDSNVSEPQAEPVSSASTSSNLVDSLKDAMGTLDDATKQEIQALLNKKTIKTASASATAANAVAPPPTLTKWQNQNSLVHVVHTRFMQHQAQLLNMGQARVDLFKTFCLPSMLHQTTQEWLWILWTDPDLAEPTLRALLESLRNVPNVVVIGNNNLISKDFRQAMSGMGEKFDPSLIMHGSRELLLDYYRASQTRILLETRLDADDAISKDYLETVQTEAASSMSQTDKGDYRVFCANHYLDWRFYAPKPRNSNPGDADTSRSTKGYLAQEQDLKGCVTVGMTMGFQTKATLEQLPTKEHHRIRELLGSCEKDPKRCVRGLGQARDPTFLALRARTPTSTSMVNVISMDTFSNMELQQNKMWDGVERDFGIGREQVWDCRARFQSNLSDILLDAIAGLCKSGHSCRQSSKEMLMKLLKETVAETGAGGVPAVASGTGSA